MFVYTISYVASIASQYQMHIVLILYFNISTVVTLAFYMLRTGKLQAWLTESLVYRVLPEIHTSISIYFKFNIPYRGSVLWWYVSRSTTLLLQTILVNIIVTCNWCILYSKFTCQVLNMEHLLVS